MGGTNFLAKKDDIVRVFFHVSTSVVGSECEDVIEIKREDWEKMSKEERSELLFETAMDHVEWYFYEVDSDGKEISSD